MLYSITQRPYFEDQLRHSASDLRRFFAQSVIGGLERLLALQAAIRIRTEVATLLVIIVIDFQHNDVVCLFSVPRWEFCSCAIPTKYKYGFLLRRTKFKKGK